MHARLSYHIVDKRKIVRDLSERRGDLAQHFSASAVWLEFPKRLEPRSEPILKRLDRFSEVARLAMMLDERRLVIE
jgi:hypothetical protein